MRLADWWLTPSWYYVLPNRLYWLLGADVIGSVGEAEWYDLHGRRLQAEPPAAALPPF